MTDELVLVRRYDRKSKTVYCFGDLGFLARQASEQYFTSSQFFAQLLRQVISRPQARQGLLGKAALLPLNPVWPIVN